MYTLNDVPATAAAVAEDAGISEAHTRPVHVVGDRS